MGLVGDASERPMCHARKSLRRVIDPVCEMEFAERDAAGWSVDQNRVYYFCHPMCKKIFDADPKRFIRDGEFETPNPVSPTQDETRRRQNLKQDSK